MASRMSEPLVWRHRTGEIVLDRTRVMGVLNVTPDSFSDRGRFLDPDAAVRRGLEMVEEGADILDIGGESTRPGSEPVPADEEWRRVSPVIQGLAGMLSIPISIDTRKPDIAQKAIRAGASIVNDVTALQDPGMVSVLANSGVGVILMHLRGEPKTMQDRPTYVDVVDEVRDFWALRMRKAVTEGIAAEAIALDPGIGFGKDLDHNLALLRHLDTLGALGRPVVVGVSRKSFLKRLGAGDEARDRLAGSLAAAAFAVAHGAHVIRAHGESYTKTMRLPMSTLIVHGDSPEAFVENVGHYLRAGQRLIYSRNRWIAGGVISIIVLSIFVVVLLYAFFVTASPGFAVWSVLLGGFLAFSVYVFWWSLTPPRPTETQERIPSLRP